MHRRAVRREQRGRTSVARPLVDSSASAIARRSSSNPARASASSASTAVRPGPRAGDVTVPPLVPAGVVDRGGAHRPTSSTVSFIARWQRGRRRDRGARRSCRPSAGAPSTNRRCGRSRRTPRPHARARRCAAPGRGDGERESGPQPGEARRRRSRRRRRCRPSSGLPVDPAVGGQVADQSDGRGASRIGRTLPPARPCALPRRTLGAVTSGGPAPGPPQRPGPAEPSRDLPPPSTAPAGWYADPDGSLPVPLLRRARWTDQTARWSVPAPTPPPVLPLAGRGRAVPCSPRR